jgi:hypothetical protein
MDKPLPTLKTQVKRFLGFIKAGWFWILLPLIIALIIILLIFLFGDPAQKGTLPLRFILLYSLF